MQAKVKIRKGDQEAYVLPESVRVWSKKDWVVVEEDAVKAEAPAQVDSTAVRNAENQQAADQVREAEIKASNVENQAESSSPEARTSRQNRSTGAGSTA